jgi:ribosome-binding factor A
LSQNRVKFYVIIYSGKNSGDKISVKVYEQVSGNKDNPVSLSALRVAKGYTSSIASVKLD